MIQACSLSSFVKRKTEKWKQGLWKRVFNILSLLGIIVYEGRLGEKKTLFPSAMLLSNWWWIHLLHRSLFFQALLYLFEKWFCIWVGGFGCGWRTVIICQGILQFIFLLLSFPSSVLFFPFLLWLSLPLKCFPFPWGDKDTLDFQQQYSTMD